MPENFRAHRRLTKKAKKQFKRLGTQYNQHISKKRDMAERLQKKRQEKRQERETQEFVDKYINVILFTFRHIHKVRQG